MVTSSGDSVGVGGDGCVSLEIVSSLERVISIDGPESSVTQ